jgi:hypothetical protein
MKVGGFYQLHLDYSPDLQLDFIQSRKSEEQTHPLRPMQISAFAGIRLFPLAYLSGRGEHIATCAPWSLRHGWLRFISIEVGAT